MSRKADAAGRVLSAVIAVLLSVVLGLALAGGGYVLLREWRVHQAQVLLAQTDRPAPERLKALDAIEASAGAQPPVRLKIAASAIRGQIALTLPTASTRRALLQQALVDATAAETAEPLNGDAALQRAYLTVLLEPSPTDPVALAAVRESYRKAPFSLNGGWRLVYAATHWTQIDPGLRVRALDEATWLVSVKPNLQPRVEAAFSDSPGEFALALRLGRFAPPKP